MSRGFLDAASGQPLSQAARLAWRAAWDRGFADPLGPHHEGKLARQLLDAASQSMADLVSAEPVTVRFLPAGAVALSYAMRGLSAIGSARHGDPALPVAVSAVDRQAALQAAARLSPGGQALVIPVTETGAARVDRIGDAVTAGASVVCLQAANPEVGTRQPLAEVARMCESARTPLLVDATGSLGRDTIEAGWSALVADAGTWGGPPGIAVFARKDSAPWREPGASDADLGSAPPPVLDVPGAVAAAASLEAAQRDGLERRAHEHALIARLREHIAARIPGVELTGDPDDRLPYVLTFSCLYVDGEVLAAELDRCGYAVGSGSACATRSGLPSHVLTAMGVLTHGNVRVSLPIECPDEVLDGFQSVIPGAVARTRAALGTADLAGDAQPGADTLHQ